MGRHRLARSVKVCKVCGEGFDAFKALTVRGAYCSPACLDEARRRQRQGTPAPETAEPAIGPAILPPSISLGNRRTVVSIGDLGIVEGEDRRLV